MKTLSYSYVNYNPRISLLLLTVEKIERENFDFALLLSSSPSSFFVPFFLLSFPSRTTQKVYSIYERSAHRKIALLLEILLFCVGVECELR